MKKLIPFILALFLSPVLALAAEGEFPEISHAELVKAIENKEVTVIDVNGTKRYRKGHIPGAINFEESERELQALLPGDKGALIVAYCGSEKCKAYKAAAKTATDLGYTNVKHYAPGIKGWEKAGAKTEKAK